MKKLKGDKPSRINENEPEYDPISIKAPSHLNPTAKVAWRRLVKMFDKAGTMSEADQDILALYCDAFSEYLKAKKQLSKRGEKMILYTPNGYQYENRWIAIRNRAATQMHKLGAELGLTPASRSRIIVDAERLMKRKPDPMEELFEECAREKRGRGE